MTIQISNANEIILDGQATKLKLAQRAGGTIIYTANHGGLNYKEHSMPQNRYSTAYEGQTKAGNPGLNQLEIDLKDLIKRGY